MYVKIGTKIGVAFGLLLVIIFSFTYFYSTSANRHEAHMHELQEEIEELGYIINLQIVLAQLGMSVKDFLITGSDHDEFLNFGAISLKADDLFQKLDIHDLGMTEERELIEHVKGDYQKVKGLAMQIFSVPHPTGNREAGRLMEEMDSLVDCASEDLKKFHDFAFEESTEVLAAWNRATSRLNRIFFSGFFISVLLIIGSLVYFRRTISLPINAIKDTAQEFAQGNLDRKVNVTTNDEIGFLANAFNTLGADLQTSYSELKKEIAERTKLQEELQVLSLTDDLTGLYNRRGFYTLVEHILKLAVRQKQGMFMMYTDMNGLKDINDRFGHQEGDNAIKDTAQILMENYRESDVIARLGGDEFAVIPVGTTGDNLDLIKTRLQEKLREFNAAQKRKYTISLSSGIAYFDPENPCSIDELLSKGDKLMYEDKRRNYNG